jgi:hypothetical protein
VYASLKPSLYFICGETGPHSPNEDDQFTAEGGSAAASARFPAPKQPEALPMPA